ncbi:Alpha/Beta hydrolase protein, partial [Globomyces pollinis-pini]
MDIPFKGTFVDIKGKQINTYHKVHPTNPNCILFIHGLGGQIAQFEYQLSYFTNHASVLALDLVGHGASPNTNNYKDFEFDSLIDDICDFIAVYEQQHPKFMLVGHSYGSALSFQLSKRITMEKVVGNVLIAPPATFPALKFIYYIPTFILDFFRWLEKLGGIESNSVMRMFAPNPSIELKTRQLQFNKTTPTLVAKHMIMGFPRLTEENFQSNFPTILIGGKYDKITPLQKDFDVFAKWASIDESKATILPAGHMIMIEKKEEVNDLIFKFAKKYSIL